MRTNFRVATYLPFWRYAVCSDDESIVGIPFYTLTAATKFQVETKKALPWTHPVLVRKTPFTKYVEVVGQL